MHGHGRLSSALPSHIIIKTKRIPLNLVQSAMIGQDWTLNQSNVLKNKTLFLYFCTSERKKQPFPDRNHKEQYKLR